MKSFYRTLAILFLYALSVYSQPKISYILPDIGAPGMNVYVEFIGPTDKLNNFGTKDTIYLNNPGDAVRVVVNDPAKANKVVIGPVVVSWTGRMISTQIFVKPDLIPTESYALSAGDEFKIPLVVEVNGVKSNAETFYIVKPYPFHNGTIANPTDVVFGEGTLGKRSPRGAIIFDSLKLAARKYTVSLTDCDPSTTYNEAFLPFVLLAKGDINGTLQGTTYTSIDVSGNGKHSGPGGGGGGGAYCDVAIGGNDGYDGGDGFTGGGPGGENSAIGGGGNKRAYGKSTGPNLSTTSDFGGYSLNGVAGPFNAIVNYEASGGGTGHPFGLSGRGTQAGNSDNPEGQFGGGSGRTQNQKGGSGGFATNGIGINISYGKAHGNSQCVPLAGGSGGASGNPFALIPRYCSGDGGGGGGAILAFGKSITGIDFISKGAKGGDGNDASDGGYGSGGMIVLSSKGTILDYGLDNTTSGSGYGWGRTDRFEGRGQRVSTGGFFKGIMTDTTTSVSRNFKIMGAPYTYDYIHYGTDKKVEKLHFYMKSESGLWEEISNAATSINGGEAWVKNISLVGNDKYHYFVAVQEIPSPSIVDYKIEPSYLMTQAGANLFRLDLHPIIDTAKCTELATNDSLNCLGANPERYFYFDIYNHAAAEADLEILSAWIENYDATNFTIFLPNKPIKPGTKETVVVKYTYQGTETNDFWCNIRIKTNDPVAKTPKYRSDSTFIGIIDLKKIVVPKLEEIGSNPANYTFDDTRTGQTSNLEIAYKNTGNCPLLITAIADVFPPSFYVIQKPALPMLLLENQEFQITLQFRPTNAGTISGKISINTVSTDSTCEFTNEITVSGKAIQSTVNVSKFEMDFGNIPWCKVVDDEVSISNPTTSTESFRLTDYAIIEGQDKNVFIITQNIATKPMVLLPDNNGVKIKVRFDPSLDKSKEDFQAELVIFTDQPENLEIRIALKGKTAHFKMAALPPSILINNAFVGFDTTYTFEMQNSGLLAEYLRTNNPIEYKNSFITKIVNSPNVINPSEKRTASFISNPSSTFMNDELWVIFDTPCDDTLKIPVTINALTTTYSLETDGSYNLVNEEIDFGKISPCETNINLTTFTSMKWKNLGNAPFIVLGEEITDSDGGIFVSQPSTSLINDTIYPAKPERVGLNFNLNIDINTLDGIYTGKYEATVYVNGKVEKKNITLKVQVEKGKFLFSDNSLDLQQIVNLADSKMFKFTNSGPWNLTINNVTGPNSTNGFSLSPSVVGKVYAANSFEDFTVTFTPAEVKDYRDSIVFDLTFGNCTDRYVIYLNGKGLPSKEVTLNLPKVVVSPALDNYKLPIYASLGKATDEIEGFKLDTVEISFNRSLYYPEKISNGKILSSYINNARRHIILEIDNIKFKGQNVVLTELTGYTMLGDVTKTDLKFEKISHKQSSIVSKISSEDGSLEIEICQEGGDRLLKQFSSAAKIEILPNPIENNAIANVFMLENGKYTLEITNLTGIVIQKIHFNKNDGENPEKLIDLNLENISSGVYTVILTTPTAKLSKMISVMK